MSDFTPPNLCQFCGGEKPSKQNKSPSAPCICDENSDGPELF